MSADSLLHTNSSVLYEAVRAIASERGEMCAIQSTDGSSVSYAELIELVDRITSGLVEHKIGNGDTVATVLRNSISYVALILAVARIGASYVPLMQNFNTVETSTAVEIARPRLLVVDGNRSSQVTGIASTTLAVLTTHLPLQREKADTVFCGQFRKLWSSGSTGFPKMIVWRQDKFLLERQRWIKDTGITDTDVFFCRHTLDVAHATDLHVFAALLSGARLILADPEAEPSILLRQLQVYQVTAMSALPRHYEQFIEAAAKAESIDLSRLRRPLCGGAYLNPATVHKAANTLGIHIRQIYGSTEFGLALGNMDDVVQADLGMVNVRGVGTRLSPLIDDQQTAGKKRDPEIGELVLQSDYTSEGYLNNDEANARTFRQGEFWTGDVARLAADGSYRIMGRVSEALATAQGPMPAPMLDEKIVDSCADVIESVTLAVDPGAYTPRAQVVLRVAAAGCEESVLLHMNCLFERYGIEGSVCVFEAIPYTPVGKPDKPLLRHLCGLGGNGS